MLIQYCVVMYFKQGNETDLYFYFTDRSRQGKFSKTCQVN